MLQTEFLDKSNQHTQQQQKTCAIINPEHKNAYPIYLHMKNQHNLLPHQKSTQKIRETRVRVEDWIGETRVGWKRENRKWRGNLHGTNQQQTRYLRLWADLNKKKLESENSSLPKHEPHLEQQNNGESEKMLWSTERLQTASRRHLAEP